jgi:hypothetical protein
MTLSVRELIERAAQLLGSETKLAKAREVSQNAISQAKSRGRAHQLSMAPAMKGDSSVPDPPRTYAPDNWTRDADAFECCCAACSSQDH